MVAGKVLYTRDEYKCMYSQGGDEYCCPYCHTFSQRVPNPSYIVPPRGSDIRITLDGFYIVSQKFKDFCESNSYTGVTFYQFPLSLGHYYMDIISPVIPIKLDKVTGASLCPYCGKQEYMHGIGISLFPGFKLDNDDFIARSDLELGAGDAQQYLILTGLETERKFREAKLKGLIFDNLYNN